MKIMYQNCKLCKGECKFVDFKSLRIQMIRIVHDRNASFIA